MVLAPILNSRQPLIVAWNNLVDKMSRQESLELLEERLCGGLCNISDQLSVQVLESLSEGIVITNEQGYIKYANQAFGAIINVELLEEAETKKLIEVMQQELLDRIRT
ncbi:MAG: PAS domain-containing protein [Planctomycetaceae bacterium]